MSWGFEFADGLNQRKHLGKVYKTVSQGGSGKFKAKGLAKYKPQAVSEIGQMNSWRL